MSERKMRTLVTAILVILTNGLAVRSGDLAFPEGGTEVSRQIARSSRTRSRSSENGYVPVQPHSTGTPAPFPADDPPPDRHSSPYRQASFARSRGQAPQTKLDVPDWISRTGPLISQTGISGPTAPRTNPPATAPKRSSDHAATADGTWREDGGFVIINLGGRQLRLRKEGSPVRTTSFSVPPYSVPSRQPVQTLPTNDAPAASRKPDSRSDDLSRFVGSRGGTVVGRLLNGHRPLVNCRVALIPIEKATFGGYDIDGKSKPQSAKTDETGRYRFDDVPAGLYKLFWLPKGTRRWIRRIQFEPDAVVRSGKTVDIKTVRIATRTVN